VGPSGPNMLHAKKQTANAVVARIRAWGFERGSGVDIGRRTWGDTWPRHEKPGHAPIIAYRHPINVRGGPQVGSVITPAAIAAYSVSIVGNVASARTHART
jgi:hypothetical protein